METLLFIDIDMTLVDSSSISYLLPSDPTADHKEWIAALAERHASFPPMKGARKALDALLHLFAPKPILLTSRYYTLEEVTREWLRVHFPEIADIDGLFRPHGDFSRSFDSKSGRLRGYRSRHPEACAWILDDDPKMEDACEEPCDRFILARFR